MSSLTELWQQQQSLLMALVFIAGSICGSFVNVVVVRLPIILERHWLQQCIAFINELLEKPRQHPFSLNINIKSPLKITNEKTTRFNLCLPRSFCPFCEKNIKAWHNVPLLSYLLLKGRCAHCQHPISPQYFFVEFFSAILATLCVFFFALTIKALAAYALCLALLSSSLIDRATQYLPDEITQPFLWLGLLVNSQSIFVPLPQALLGAVIGYLLLWSIYWLFKMLTGRDGIGAGDFKYLALLGAWLGWSALPLIIIVSSGLGSLVGLLLIAHQRLKRTASIPFGPFLACGGLLALFYGPTLNAAYLSWLSI